jgi:PIN domain nuclease of toxin-antitoxin system
MLNLDTHILLFALNGTLTAKEREVLSRDHWSISAIVLWELSKLAELGRISLDLNDPDFEDAMSRVHVWPITLEICRAIAGLDFDSDPADEIIAATSVVEGVALVTRDKKLRGSKVVPIAG